MKKILVGLSSIIALLGGMFALSSAVQAGGGPHIALTSQNGSWTVLDGYDFTVFAQVYPVDAKIANIYFYSDSTLIKTCSATNNCSATVVDPTLGNHTLFVFAVDSTGNYYYLNGAYTQNFTVVASAPVLPTVTLTQTGKAYANTTGTAGVFLQAQAQGTNLQSVKIVRLDSDAHNISTDCMNQRTTCAVGTYPTFTSAQIGGTYLYQATVTDAAGHKVSSQVISVKVVAKSNSTQTPVTPRNRLNPVLAATPSTLGANQRLTLNGTATNANGVWGVEVRALPSWSNVALKNRCILNNRPTTGNCSLNIGSFAGHVGQTVKVWVIYWDARTGNGYSSEMRTIRITQ